MHISLWLAQLGYDVLTHHCAWILHFTAGIQLASSAHMPKICQGHHHCSGGVSGGYEGCCIMSGQLGEEGAVGN